MKPIKRQDTQQDVIFTDEIDEDHIIVMVYENEPYILSKPIDKNYKYSRFLHLKIDTTCGNGYDYGGEGESLEKVVESWMNEPYAEIAIFKNGDWFEAMKWLHERTKS